MSTAAALMTAAARRLSRSTASTMVLREVSGSHTLTIDGCTFSKDLAKGWAWSSRSFDVAGHSWRIRYKPQRGGDGEIASISLHLELDGRARKDDRIGSVKLIRFSLLDQSGNPMPKFTRAITEPCAFDGWSKFHGFTDFVRWKDLVELGCVKDDTFSVQCDITVTADLAELGVAYDDGGAAAPATAAGENRLADLMWKDKRGADVTVDVGGEATFDAHGWLLAEHSPILRAMVCTTASKEKKTSHRRIVIKGVDAKVFEAVLEYMYTDALPEMDDDMAMAKGLLDAADKFKIEGLKLKCEETLSKDIDVSTAAGILAVAEQHGCKALKAACVEFLSRRENMKAVMESEGYEKARPIVHPIVTEIAVKKWLASSTHHT